MSLDSNKNPVQIEDSRDNRRDNGDRLNLVHGSLSA